MELLPLQLELGNTLPGWQCSHSFRGVRLAQERRNKPEDSCPPLQQYLEFLCPPSGLWDTPTSAGLHPAQTDKGNATPLIRKFEAFPWIYQLPVFPGPRSFCPCRVKSDSHLLCCCKGHKDKALPHKNTMWRGLIDISNQHFILLDITIADNSGITALRRRFMWNPNLQTLK